VLVVQATATANALLAAVVLVECCWKQAYILMPMSLSQSVQAAQAIQLATAVLLVAHRPVQLFPIFPLSAAGLVDDALAITAFLVKQVHLVVAVVDHKLV
jgi:hypothetical protein